MEKIKLLTQNEVEEKYQYLLDEEAMGEINLLCAMANNPEVLQSYMRYGSTLWEQSGLEPEEVELLILSVASALEAKYEWQQHVPIALDMGVNRETIQTIAREEYDNLTDRHQAIIQYAIAVATEENTDDWCDELANHVDEGTIVGTTLLSSHYLATARFLAALSIPLEESFIGWNLSNLD